MTRVDSGGAASDVVYHEGRMPHECNAPAWVLEAEVIPMRRIASTAAVTGPTVLCAEAAELVVKAGRSPTFSNGRLGICQDLRLVV